MPITNTSDLMLDFLDIHEMQNFCSLNKNNYNLCKNNMCLIYLHIF